MTVYNGWTVQVGTSVLTDVQDVQIDVGRRKATDSWPISTGQVTLRYPTGYSSPVSGLSIGSQCRIYAPGRYALGQPTWTGTISDVSLDVGIPWNSSTSTGNADFVTISAEGHLAAVGRWVNFPGTSYSFLDPDSQFTQMKNAGINIGWSATGNWSQDSNNWWAPPATWTFQPLELLQQLATYTGCRIVDGVRGTWSGSKTTAGIWIAPPMETAPISPSPNWKRIAPTSFSDTTNNATNRIFDGLNFDSLADNYWTQGVISDGTTSYTASYGAAPYRSFYGEGPDNISSTYANNYQGVAQYYANNFAQPTTALTSISATTADQQTQNLDTLGLASPSGSLNLELGYIIQHLVNVTFRGTTTLCQIEGVTVSADTSQARFTYYLTPSDIASWFTLNNTDFGVLDTDRLGRYNWL